MSDDGLFSVASLRPAQVLDATPITEQRVHDVFTGLPELELVWTRRYHRNWAKAGSGDAEAAAEVLRDLQAVVAAGRALTPADQRTRDRARQVVASGLVGSGAASDRDIALDLIDEKGERRG